MILLFFCEQKNKKSQSTCMTERLVLLAFLIFAAAHDSLAEESGSVHPWLDKKFVIEVGVFYPERMARFKARGSVDLPSPETLEPAESIDFGEQFSISQSDKTFAAEFGWRYARNWTLRMQYFDSRGSNSAVLEEDIEWEDLTFLAGTNATAGTEFELTRFVWDYRILNQPNQHLGLSGGFHWLHIRGYIEGTVLEPSGPTFRGESASVDAPLPNIGFTYVRALSSRWGFRTRFDWFSADIHPYDGIFINASAGFNYSMSDWFGVGINYNFVELDVGVDGDNWRGEIETRYDGFYIYLNAAW